MRYLSLIAVLLMLPVTATAQQRRGSGERRSEGRPSQQQQNRQADQRPANEVTPFTLQSALRANGMPIKPQLWWERQATPSWIPTWQTNDRPFVDDRHDGKSRRNYGGRYGARGYNNGVIYVAPGYPFFPYTYAGSSTYVETQPPPSEIVTRPADPPPAPAPPPPPMGVLRLEVEPRDAIQIFIDGVYVGTPADFNDEIGLAPGTRRIELRARGYKTVTFSAEIVQDRAITYRATLERDPQAPAPAPVVIKPAAAPGSSTIYMIPGCYLGNVAPIAAALRPGCDLSKLTKFEP